MKKILTLLLLLVTLSCYSQLKIGTDKYYHFGAGCVISGGMWTIQQHCYEDTNPIFPTLLATLAGVGKEALDVYSSKRVSYRDIAFTFIGGAVTNTVLYFVWNKKRIKKRKLNNIIDEFPLVKK